MAVTRLKRKHRKNIARANNKQRVIKQLLATPVIKNVDVEELKAQFKSNPETGAVKKEKGASAAQTETPKVEKSAEKETAPVAAAPEKTEEASTGIFATVKDAIVDAAHTVVEKVEDVVEAVKDRVSPDTTPDTTEEEKEAK